MTLADTTNGLYILWQELKTNYIFLKVKFEFHVRVQLTALM